MKRRNRIFTLLAWRGFSLLLHNAAKSQNAASFPHPLSSQAPLIFCPSISFPTAAFWDTQKQTIYRQKTVSLCVKARFSKGIFGCCAASSLPIKGWHGLCANKRIIAFYFRSRSEIVQRNRVFVVRSEIRGVGSPNPSTGGETPPPDKSGCKHLRFRFVLCTFFLHKPLLYLLQERTISMITFTVSAVWGIMLSDVTLYLVQVGVFL